MLSGVEAPAVIPRADAGSSGSSASSASVLTTSARVPADLATSASLSVFELLRDPSTTISAQRRASSRTAFCRFVVA